MNNIKKQNTAFIYYSFFIALILQITPWPLQLYSLQPSWLNLILIYWIMIIPEKINIGTGFILGLIMDLILDSTLGIHSLAFSIIAYLITYHLHFLHNLLIYKQTFIIILLSIIMKTIVTIANILTNNILFNPEIFLGSIADGLLWPGFLLIMKTFTNYYKIKNKK